jgi:hypothetical protein
MHLYLIFCSYSMSNFCNELVDPRKQEKLDWIRRYNITGRIAREIQYLHEDSRLRSIARCQYESKNFRFWHDKNFWN